MKKITYKLTHDDSYLISSNPEDFVEEIKSFSEDLEEGDSVEFTITIEKKYTEEELENLPEFDGW